LISRSLVRRLLPLIAAVAVLSALVLTTTAGGAPVGPLKYDELPDPLARGTYTVKRVDPLVLGTYSFDEPNGKGGEPTGSNAPLTEAQVRGVLYMPEGKTGKSPLLFFVHGNHGSCDTGTGPKCTLYKRNDEGYAYMGENLASWGYTVFSLDQDELMAQQDGSFGKGMHARRLLIMAALDKLKEASEGTVPTGANSNVGSLLAGKLDMTRIGLMGHSRGGDVVSSFIQYDQTRPVGERFPLRAVVSIAPVDYERHAPYGVPYMSVFGSCDGDVSNLQGARLYERSQYENDDPYPRFQVVQVGGNHDAYNTVWQADGDDASQPDAACGPDVAGAKGEVNKNGEEVNVLGKPTGIDPHSIRLSGEAGPHFEAAEGETKPYVWGNGVGGATKLDPAVNTRISGNPALMGDQEKMGLATVAAFFRRYVGGEGAFEPYLTGELAAEGDPSIPQSACPTSEAGERIPCNDRVADSYTAPPAEREDVLRPDTEHPTTVDALGTRIEAKGFVNPYLANGGIQPVPATTPNGIAWCDPDPKQTEPGLLGEGEFPVATKGCPQPAAHTLGGQGKNEVQGTESSKEPRENAPVNGSYGRQLSLAWEGKAVMGLPIPAADGDVSKYRALYMATAVNFFDPRNPARGEEGLWNPEAAPQNFTIAVTDAEGDEATVEAADPDFGTATQQTLGSTSDRVHVMLRDLRVPLAEFADQGVDLSSVRKIELRFAGEGMPQSGSIQLADVRFEQPATGYSDVLLDSTAPNAGPGEGPPASGPNPVAEFMEGGAYQRADGSYEIPDVTKTPGANVWTVDDDGAQCPNAEFTHIQEAIEYANPWDTIVVCPGVYEESSTPLSSSANPVAAGQKDGLTITKPLKIVGAGAGEVTIKPAAGIASLGGSAPSLRDGGGNVITVSRQSLGSTEYDEDFVDISGVTIESGSTAAEAGVAFFNASGRIADSVVGPITAANGNGWGVVETNSLTAQGEGAPERQVTIVDSTVKGYGAGGVLFDGSKGEAASTTRSGMNQVGYVFDSTIEGSGGSSAVPQIGVAYRSGAHGEVTGTAVVGNHGSTGTSYGILAADAGTLAVEGSRIAGNGGAGYGLFDANADVSGVGTGEPVVAAGDFWGDGGAPLTGETVLGPPDEEGVGGPVTVSSPLGSAPTVPPVPAAMPDAAPVGEIVDPAGGEAAEVGVTAEPVVFAEDDYGVKSVSLEADGTPVATVGEAPYAFEWTPTAAELNKSVTLTATITDSSGQVTTDEVTVPVIRPTRAKTERELAEEKEAKEATEKASAEELAAAEAAAAEALALAETQFAEATAKAEAAAKAAADSASAEAKAAAEKAAAELKAAEAKVAQAEKELEAAERAAPVSTGKVTRNTKKGTARLGVVVPASGQLTISGPGIKKVSGNPTGPGEVQVLIQAKGGALKTLDKKGKVTVKVTVKLSTKSGTKSTTTTVTLMKK
jgi:hypothetical protein